MKKNHDRRVPQLPVLQNEFALFPFLNQTGARIIVFVVALVFYISSINGEYALDDGIIIHQNDHVVKGISGIKDIMTHDAYESFYRRMCASDQLAGGRYRPLSAVSFAIEQEILGCFRTGLYTRTEDSNKNGILDRDPVTFVNPCGRTEKNYEYNDFVDRNGDRQVQAEECYSCWDRNQNFANDRDEDINSDGLFNEVDCHLYGASFRHFNNIWTYALACLLLYITLSGCFFRQNQDLALLSALIFTIHPIHSEAVANVKSRDEIFSLIFICLTFIQTFRYLENKQPRHLLFACISFLLALLSKEYAIMLLALVPLAVYTFTINDIDIRTIIRIPEFKKALVVVLAFTVCAALMTYVKRNADIHAQPGTQPTRSFWIFPFLFIFAGVYLPGAHARRNFLQLMAWIFFTALIYIGLRWMAVKLKPGVPDTEILNNPYLLANGQERFCTKTYVLLKYLRLQLFPHPLSSDYSFNSIPYRNFSSWDFWFSLLLHLVIAGAAVYFTLKKHLLGFAFMTYILFALLIANIVMDIGATMGERLIFHASIGFCIALAWVILKLLKYIHRPSLARLILYPSLVIISILAGIKTWERNFDWKNDITLFLKDAKTMPNSVLCLGNAGARYVDLSDTRFINGTKLPGYDTLFDDHNGTLAHIEQEVKEGKYKSRREAVIHHGIEVLTRAIELHPRYVNGYLNLGLLYLKLKKDYETLYYLKNAERLYPNNPYLRNYYAVFTADLRNRAALALQRNRIDSAAIAYNTWSIVEPNNPDVRYQLGGLFYNMGCYELARRHWVKALELRPGFKEAQAGLGMIRPEMLPARQTLAN